MGVGEQGVSPKFFYWIIQPHLQGLATGASYSQDPSHSPVNVAANLLTNSAWKTTAPNQTAPTLLYVSLSKSGGIDTAKIPGPFHMSLYKYISQASSYDLSVVKIMKTIYIMDPSKRSAASCLNCTQTHVRWYEVKQQSEKPAVTWKQILHISKQ